MCIGVPRLKKLVSNIGSALILLPCVFLDVVKSLLWQRERERETEQKREEAESKSESEYERERREREKACTNHQCAFDCEYICAKDMF
jgi:hypothetical protein